MYLQFADPLPIAIPGPIAAVLAVGVLLALAMRPAIGVAALLAIYPFLQHVPRTPIPGVNAETILVLFALLIALARSGLRLPPLRATGVVVGFLVVMTMGWMIANTWMDVPQPEWSTWGRFKALKSRLFAALLFFVGYWIVRGPRDRTRVFEAISVGVLVAGSSVIADFVLGLAPRRASGLFTNSNHVGDYLSACAVFPLYLATRRDIAIPRRGLHAVAYGIGVVATVLTLSRASWVALAAGHFVWFLMVNRRILLVGAVAALLFATAWYPFMPELVRERIELTFRTGAVSYKTPGALDLESSAASRIIHHMAGYHMFLDSPIWGHGNEAFHLRSVEYGAQYGLVAPKTPHSVLLKVATENGLIGLAALAGLFVVLVSTGYRIWRTGGEDRAVGALIIALTISQSVGNLFHTGFLVTGTTGSAVWLLLGAGSHLAGTISIRASRRRGAALARILRGPLPASSG